MRTRRSLIGPPPTAGQSSWPRACWAARAAARAPPAWGKAAQKASPIVLKTVPPCPVILACKIASWRANARCMAAGYSSQSRVLPSISVNRKQIVPAGGCATDILRSAAHPAQEALGGGDAADDVGEFHFFVRGVQVVVGQPKPHHDTRRLQLLDEQ